MSSRLGAGPIRVFLVTGRPSGRAPVMSGSSGFLQGAGQPPSVMRSPTRRRTRPANLRITQKGQRAVSSQRRRRAAREVLGLMLEAVLRPGYGAQSRRFDGLAVDGAAAERAGLDAAERAVDLVEVAAGARDTREQAVADGRLDGGIAAVGDPVVVRDVLQFPLRAFELVLRLLALGFELLDQGI